MNKQRLLLLGCCLVFLLAGLGTLSQFHRYTPDSSRYLIWATSLSQFDGFIDRTLPEPQRYVVHAPAYPVLLAPVVAVVPDAMTGAKILTLLFGAGTLALFFFWLKHFFSESYALVGTILLGVHGLFFTLSGEALSDVPFLFFFILFLLLLEKKERMVTPSVMIPWMIGLTTAACMLLREIGIVLVAAVVISGLLDRQYQISFRMLIIPLILYSVWFFRNEVLIAGKEQPLFSNLMLFTSRYYTSPETSLLAEYWARIQRQAVEYGAMTFHAFTMPLRPDLMAGLDDGGASWFTGSGFATALRFMLGAVSLTGSLYGVYLDARHGSPGRIRALMVALYTGLLLLYPIHDVRFFLPLLTMMIFYLMTAWINLLKKLSRGPLRSSLIAIGAVSALTVMVMHSAWYSEKLSAVQSISKRETVITEASPADGHAYPDLKDAGEWIQRHSDPSAVVVSEWKDLYYWIGNRKVLVAERFISPDYLDNMIRDYNIRYAVISIDHGGIRELEFQMTASKKYDFISVYRSRLVEIRQIMDRITRREETDTAEFSQAVRLLVGGNYEAAERRFNTIEQTSSSMVPVFFRAVSQECQEQWVEARSAYTMLTGIPQSGTMLHRTDNHLRLIDLQLRARHDIAPVALLSSAALGYWELGLRSRARTLMNQVIELDSSRASSFIMAAYFALKEKDPESSARYLRTYRATDTTENRTATLLNLVLLSDSAAIIPYPAFERQRRLMVQYCLDLKLFDEAIDELLLMNRNDPSAGWVSALLAKLYHSKRRYASALHFVEQALKSDSVNTNLISLRNELRERLWME